MRKKLRRLHQKLSRVEKRTVRYRKVLLALKKTYYRLKCKRSAFFYEQAYRLFEHHDVVILEDLDIVSMTRRPLPQKEEETGKYLPNGASQKKRLNASIYDVGWGLFVRTLEHIASKIGKQVVKIDPRFTTQKCNNCSELVKKSSSVRTHCCPSCGYVANRDYNAAKNILRLGLESLEIILEAPTIMHCI